MPEPESAAPAAMVAKAADSLRAAKRPVILAGRMSRDLGRLERSTSLWQSGFGARVITV